jgi:hypothetical protein
MNGICGPSLIRKLPTPTPPSTVPTPNSTSLPCPLPSSNYSYSLNRYTCSSVLSSSGRYRPEEVNNVWRQLLLSIAPTVHHCATYGDGHPNKDTQHVTGTYNT